MTTLYRSPNVIIEQHEWHVAVIKRDGRTARRYFWRPLSSKETPWYSLDKWEGRKPALHYHFAVFHNHVKRALESEARRRQAATRWAGSARQIALQGAVCL